MTSPVGSANSPVSGVRPASGSMCPASMGRVPDEDEKSSEAQRLAREAEGHINALAVRLKKEAVKIGLDRTGEIDALKDRAIDIIRRVLGNCRTCDNPLMFSLANIYDYLSEYSFRDLRTDPFEKVLSMFKAAIDTLERSIPNVCIDDDKDGSIRKKWNDFAEVIMNCTCDVIIAANLEKEAEENLEALAGKFEKVASARTGELRARMIATADRLRTKGRSQVRELYMRDPRNWSSQKSCARLYGYVLANLGGDRMSVEECMAYLEKYSPQIEKYWDTVSEERIRAFQQKQGIELISIEQASKEEQRLFFYKKEDHSRYALEYSNFDIRSAIGRIENALSHYPAEIRGLFPRRMIFDSKASFLGGAITFGKTKAFMINLNQSDLMDHEMFHWLEKVTLSANYQMNDSLWKRITGSVYEGEWSWLNADRKGYATGYALTDSDEDRATVAQMLFTLNAGQLKVKLFNDPMLLTKVELMTGCHYDQAQGRFVKLYTKEELRDCYGLSDYLYYAKWSTVNGRVLMDADYWNGILAQHGMAKR